MASIFLSQLRLHPQSSFPPKGDRMKATPERTTAELGKGEQNLSIWGALEV